MAAQYRFHFACVHRGLFDVPLWRKPGVQHGEPQPGIVMQQRAVTQPAQKFLTIRRVKDIAEGVLALEMAAVASDLRGTIHPHPTLSETIYEAAQQLFKP